MAIANAYSTIVYFKQVGIGQVFASTKTGREYRKIDATTGVDITGAADSFTGQFLVYLVASDKPRNLAPVDIAARLNPA